MALIKCKECGKDISDTTDVCIHCGAPTSISTNGGNTTKSKRHNNRNVIITIIVCLLIMAFVIVGIPFLLSLKHKGSTTLDAEYSAPEYEYIYGDAMRAIFRFKDDGTVIFQRCNIDTDACADPHSYTYQRNGIDVDIYDTGDSPLYECYLKDSEAILRCSNSSGGYQDYAKIID